MLKSKMITYYENNQQAFKAYDLNRMAGLAMESGVSRQVQHTKRWKKQLSAETANSFSTNIRQIMDRLPDKEISQTSFEPTKGKGPMSSASAQPASQISVSFRGTFRTVQRALLELETRMPQLQLQELRIDPISNQPSLLNFQVSYTAWEN